MSSQLKTGHDFCWMGVEYATCPQSAPLMQHPQNARAQHAHGRGLPAAGQLSSPPASSSSAAAAAGPGQQGGDKGESLSDMQILREVFQ